MSLADPHKEGQSVPITKYFSYAPEISLLGANTVPSPTDTILACVIANGVVSSKHTHDYTELLRYIHVKPGNTVPGMRPMDSPLMEKYKNILLRWGVLTFADQTIQRKQKQQQQQKQPVSSTETDLSFASNVSRSELVRDALKLSKFDAKTDGTNAFNHFIKSCDPQPFFEFLEKVFADPNARPLLYFVSFILQYYPTHVHIDEQLIAYSFARFPQSGSLVAMFLTDLNMFLSTEPPPAKATKADLLKLNARVNGTNRRCTVQEFLEARYAEAARDIPKGTTVLHLHVIHGKLFSHMQNI